MRILFMGTPDFSLPCLNVCADNHELIGVFTQPDRPSGRGHKSAPPPVKIVAEQIGVPVYQPYSMSEQGIVKQIVSLSPDLIVVVAYGQLLPERVLNIPPLGCVNVHGSLLPKYRGAAPVQRAMMNGDAQTGVTTIYMDKTLDTGDIILSRTTPILPEMTSAELWNNLSVLGAECLERTLELIACGKAPRIPQNHEEATFAPKLEKSDGIIDFNSPTNAVIGRIKGVTPWPGAVTQLGGDTLKIHLACPAEGRGAPGEILHKKRLIVATLDGAVELLKVQLPGKTALTGKQMMQGRRLSVGDIVG